MKVKCWQRGQIHWRKLYHIAVEVMLALAIQMVDRRTNKCHRITWESGEYSETGYITSTNSALTKQLSHNQPAIQL